MCAASGHGSPVRPELRSGLPQSNDSRATKEFIFLPMSTHDINDVLSRAAPVIPVLTIERVEDAVPLARALLAGGIRSLEVTLRTKAAVEAIRALKAEVPTALVGAGTVTHTDQLRQLEQLRVDFAISPGATHALLQAGLRTSIPYLPAVATASEMMVAMELGYSCFKFFPSVAYGGVAALKALAGPFPHVRFCPTGGIGLQDAADYLALPSVLCVGGSWIAPADAVAQQDWKRIEQRARETVEKLGSRR